MELAPPARVSARPSSGFLKSTDPRNSPGRPEQHPTRTGVLRTPTCPGRDRCGRLQGCRPPVAYTCEAAQNRCGRPQSLARGARSLPKATDQRGARPPGPARARTLSARAARKLGGRLQGPLGSPAAVCEGCSEVRRPSARAARKLGSNLRGVLGSSAAVCEGCSRGCRDAVYRGGRARSSFSALPERRASTCQGRRSRWPARTSSARTGTRTPNRPLDRSWGDRRGETSTTQPAWSRPPPPRQDA